MSDVVKTTPRGRNLGKRGFTLIEAMLYCTLMALFATIFFLSLPSKSNASAEGLGRSAELGGILAARLSGKISNGAETKIVLQNQGRTLVLLTATDDRHPQFTYDSSGKLQWRQWEYFALHEGKLHQVIVPLAAPTLKEDVGQPSELSTAQLTKGRVFSNHVKTFKVSQVKEGFQLAISLETDGASFPIRTLARPRN